MVADTLHAASAERVLACRESIVEIDFVRRQPRSSWEENWPEAYGFYSNVNPTNDHPGHSQAQERRIGEF